MKRPLALLLAAIVGAGCYEGPIGISPKTSFDVLWLDAEAKQFERENGRVPESKEEFSAWLSLHSDRPWPTDPFGREYVYELLDSGRCRILTLGRDGKPGGSGLDQDISSEAPDPCYLCRHAQEAPRPLARFERWIARLMEEDR